MSSDINIGTTLDKQLLDIAPVKIGLFLGVIQQSKTEYFHFQMIQIYIHFLRDLGKGIREDYNHSSFQNELQLHTLLFTAVTAAGIASLLHLQKPMKILWISVLPTLLGNGS